MIMIRAGLVLGVLAVSAAHAQAPAPPAQQSIAATLEIYVFPSAGQKPEQQSKDEGECYQWAVTNAGIDPFELKKQKEAEAQQAPAAQQQAAQAGQGAGARGAVRGAAVGALVGEIADDDAGKGAAYGAAAGAIGGRRRDHAAEQQAQSQAQAQAQAQQTQAQQTQEATQQQLDNFNKAFSACLEGKEYTVKY